MERFRADVQLALRMLLRKPGFTSVAVLTLALGIAVNATMFSLVSAFLLRRPAVLDPNRLAVVSSVNPKAVFLADAYGVSAPNYLTWSKANHVFADTAASDDFRTVSLSSQGSPAAGQSGASGQPEALRASAVSANYFRVLGVSPKIGRTFVEGEDQPGRDHVVLLSHQLWERRFGADASIIERTIRINRENYSVVGVMPENYQLLGITAQLWIPLTLTAADETAAARNDHSLLVIGRLKPGANFEQAGAEFKTFARRAAEDFPDSEKGWGVAVRTLPDYLIYNFSIAGALAVLMTMVSFVLLIACANVAGLLLARSTWRRKELAIRMALGAGRLRIVRQLLTEGLVLAGFGCGAGLVLSYWGIQLLGASMTFNEAVSAVPLTLDRNVLFFAMGVSMVCAVLCALAPALNASRTDINTNLKDESRAATPGRGHHRLRTVLVTAEIAFALFLLIGTGLLIRGLYVLQHQDLGFRTDHLLTADISLDKARYGDATKQARFVRDLLSRLQQIPGVEAVAATSDLPATGADHTRLQIKGQPELPANQRPDPLDVIVTPEYFRTAGIPVLRGRTFTEADNATAPHVIAVNEEFVRRYLQGQEPLGQQVQLEAGGTQPGWSEIVGVVGNVKTHSEGIRIEPEVFEPLYVRPQSAFSLMLRAAPDPDSLAPAMRNAVAQLDAELPLSHVRSMDAVIEYQKSGNGVFEQLLGTFATLALLLAAIGIYGLIAYSVGQRTHEIGIRMALGAGTGNVLRMILWEGVKMAAIGGAIGIAMAVPLPKILESIFFDSRFGEPRLYFIVPVAIFAVALLATIVPARRAARVDPMMALRQE